MASSVVIKVKYGDTLRRFNALVKGENHLDLNMRELGEKIRFLFKFSPDADFTLTYIDEDDDHVTLADDEDLCDVMRQGLNPIRIFVHLNAAKGASSSVKSSGTSSPSRSTAQDLHQIINSNMEAGLKSVPVPVREVLSKLSLELASKAASASPVVSDLLDNLLKIGLNASQPIATATTSSSNEVHSNPEHSSVIEKFDACVNEGIKSDGIQMSNSVRPTSSSVLMPDAVDGLKGAGSARPSFMLHKGKEVYPGHDSCVKNSATATRSGVNEDVVNLPQFETNNNKDNGIIRDPAVNSGFDYLKHYRPIQSERSKAIHDKKKAKSSGNSSKTAVDSPPAGECPFTGAPVPPRHGQIFGAAPIQNPNWSVTSADGMGSIGYMGSMSPMGYTSSFFHKGVRCDGCGSLPITGPRYKSKIKHDFDLCGICFARVGNPADYSIIDFPLYRHRSLKGCYDPMLARHAPMLPPTLMKAFPSRHPRSKVDSCFIKDVNVVDETMMAPSTPFTKIWRMRNNGSIPWSHGLQLAFIGGDRFSASDSVEIEIPAHGVNVGEDLDVAVDFIAPELPGRYISYWRMADQSGHKFGQRVWVLIQVDASLKDSTCDNTSLNLNLPAQSSLEDPISVVNVEPSPNVEGGELDSALEAAHPSIIEQKRKTEIEDLNFPINDDLLVSATTLSSSSSSRVGVSAGETPISSVTSSVSHPEVVASAPPSPLYPVINDMSKEASSSSSGAEIDKRDSDGIRYGKEVEESLLKELERMGFKQVDLNKEVLRMNEYDLERSLDELCGVSGWDPILDELKEMGFQDKETNRKLLAKNNGSITRVVMDLISEENP